MDEYEQIEMEWMERHPGLAPPSIAQQMQLYPMPVSTPMYPLAQVPTTPEPAAPLLQRRLAGIPVWGWGLAAGGLGLAYYLLSGSKKVEANPSSGESGVGDTSESSESSAWRPSRSAFGDRLRLNLQKNGIAEKTVVYTDADEARKRLKQVSPLVTIQCKGVAKIPVKELDKFARREGLTAVEHDSGIVGFYPGGGKKGKAWEEYIDALRDEGQEV